MTAMIAPQRGATGSNMGSKTPSGYEEARIQNFTPEMMQVFQEMMKHVSPDSYTSRLAAGDEDLFNQMEGSAKRQFAGQQGNIASRFSGMGMGSRNSSGFQNTMNQASSDFSQDLQSKRQELMRQAIQDLMGMSKDILGQKPYDTSLVEKSKPFWQSFLSSGAQGFGQGAGQAVTAALMG